MNIQVVKDRGKTQAVQEGPSKHKRDTAFESCWPLPADPVPGHVSRIKFRPGLDLFVMDYDPGEGLKMSSGDWPIGFGFKFFISGAMKYKNCAMKDEMVMTGGLNRFAFFPVSKGTGQSLSSERVKVVTIAMAPPLFSALFGNDTGCPDPVQILDRDPGELPPFYRISRNTPAMEAAAREIMNCPYHGAVRQVFLESKALELVARQLDLVTPSHENSVPVPNDERDRLEFARQILINQMDAPPSFLELARMAGLPHNRLSSGFRKAFGATPFTLLKDIRLDKARRLLEENQGNITEIAYEVGYTSLSHFARAFKEKFGLSPKQYQLTRR